MVEAGQTNVKVYATLGKEFVIKRVEFVCNVTAKHDREETTNVAILGQKQIKTPTAPGDVVAIRLRCQCHLRMVEIRVLKTCQLNAKHEICIYFTAKIALHYIRALKHLKHLLWYLEISFLCCSE